MARCRFAGTLRAPSPPGRAHNPSYDRSPAETLLEAANEAVSRSREEGQTLNAAIEEHARLYGVDPEKLRDYRTGKYMITEPRSIT
jgi:hypothetical protein